MFQIKQVVNDCAARDQLIVDFVGKINSIGNGNVKGPLLASKINFTNNSGNDLTSVWTPGPVHLGRLSTWIGFPDAISTIHSFLEIHLF